MIEALDAAGMKFTPAKIWEEEVDYIRTELYGHLSPRRSSGSQHPARLAEVQQEQRRREDDDKLAADNRVRVDWMSIDEAVALIDAAQGVERPVVHLELRLMMRRCEVVRLTVQDVYQGSLEARGKGHGKGKWRSLAFAPETLLVLQEWEISARGSSRRPRNRDPSVKVPDSYLMWREGAKVYPYSEARDGYRQDRASDGREGGDHSADREPHV